MRLFVERAAAVQPAFAVTERNARPIAEICRRLDGLPLALELAAARVRVLGVEDLLARLEDRFRLLTGGARTAAGRHRTLRAAVDWSYDLLTARERALFARVSVFAGGFTLEAAEAVGAGEGLGAADVLDLLTRLVDQSLVAVDAQPDGTVRYRLLETLRQYGQQQLAASGGGGAVRDRHAAYYAALAERAAPELRGPASAAWHDRVERDLGNVRGALGWAAAGGPAAAGLRLATALFWFWNWRRPLEGRAWLARLLARPAPGAAGPPGGRGRPRPARARAERRGRAFAVDEGDLEAAQAQGEEALALARRAGDRPAVAAASCAARLGRRRPRRGRRGPVAVGGEPGAVRGSSATGSGWPAPCGRWPGSAARGRDDALAEAHLRRALALHREAGDRSGAAGVLGQLGSLARAPGGLRRGARGVRGEPGALPRGRRPAGLRRRAGAPRRAGRGARGSTRPSVSTMGETRWPAKPSAREGGEGTVPRGNCTENHNNIIITAAVGSAA